MRTRHQCQDVACSAADRMPSSLLTKAHSPHSCAWFLAAGCARCLCLALPGTDPGHAVRRAGRQHCGSSYCGAGGTLSARDEWNCCAQGRHAQQPACHSCRPGPGAGQPQGHGAGAGSSCGSAQTRRIHLPPARTHPAVKGVCTMGQRCSAAQCKCIIQHWPHFANFCVLNM